MAQSFISPIGTVDRVGGPLEDVRLINDYSFPEGKSVNDYTDRGNFPPVYAFRHVILITIAVHMFAFCFEQWLVVDLSCGFGWFGSPTFYSLAATIINHLYEYGNRINRQFIGNVWCDDHTCVEVDSGSRCHYANISTRRAMATVLGPTAINKKKFNH
ncbi:hypothetical protein PHMEG_00011349 [Phytophthora megakarya]|uniref:Uncharacterized protein n=1 Tax=Phytophthora megakarya TaxID=4795 RepID=A0A225WBF6_9STRA|nr:hypothetical protein PHMEG_00011349 [Phytophthora megakarya]